MRSIEPALVTFLDKKLKEHGAFHAAILRKDARSALCYAAEVCVGIRESGGNNRGKMVQLFQETIGSAVSEPWCMSFVQSIVAYIELKLNIKSPLFASEHCMTVWNETPKTQRVRLVPAPGAITIWKKGSGTSGHTSFMTEWMGSKFESIEGNTESGVMPSGEVQRDGGGVYRNIRNSKGTGSMKIIGFLKPF